MTMLNSLRNPWDATRERLGRPLADDPARPPRRSRAGRGPRVERLEERVVMAAWLTPTTANFNTGARWTGGRVPGSADTADVLVGGSSYTITIDRPTTVSTLNINSGVATVNHNAGLFTLANAKLATLNNGRLNIAAGAQFIVPQGGTFRYNSGILSGTVKVTNGGTVDKVSGFSNAPGAKFLFDGFGTLKAAQIGSGQTVTIDAPINSNVGAFVTLPASGVINNGRLELINSRNTIGEARLQFNAGSAVNNGVFQNFAGGSVFLDGPGAKRISGRLENNGLVDFGPRLQRLQVDFGLVSTGTGGTYRMKWSDPNISDVLDVRGNVNLGGQLELVSLTAIPVGRTTVIIRNDGTDAVFGTFTNVPEGTVLTFAGQQFRVSYRGGDGNDVTLTRVNVPSQFPDRVILNPRGTTAVLSGVASDPDPGAVFYLTVNWGDGTHPNTYVYHNKSGQRVNVAHQYARPGTYTLRIRWVDQYGAGKSATMTARVGHTR